MPLGGLATRQPVAKYLAYYQESQYWPREIIAAERDRALHETIKVAYQEVPFYRDLYREHGVHPRDILCADDMHKLPVVTKQMLSAAYPDRCLRHTGFPTEEQATSGSTGQPFRSMIDTDSQARARALMFLRAMMSGYKPGDAMVQTGISGNRHGLKGWKDRLLAITYVPTVDLSDSALDKALHSMVSRRARYLMGTAQSMHLLAMRAIEVGTRHRLAGAVSWGSHLLPQHRYAIQEAFGCRTIDTYGVSEGMQVASQCGEDHGEYHLFALHVFTEFCHDGHPVPTGETGEVLLTRLNPGVMPFIRYQVGDLGRASTRKTCPCERTLPMMASLVGRTADIILTPRGNRLTVHFFSHLFGQMSEIRSFQVHQTTSDHLHLLIATDGPADARASDTIRDLIKNEGDPDLQITIEWVDEIQLEMTGKQKYIVSTVELQ